MSPNRTNLDLVTSRFLIPPLPEAFLAEFDTAARAFDGPLAEIAGAFRRNVSAVLSTCSVPYQLIVDAVQRSRFQQLITVERIQRTPAPGEPSEPAAEEEAFAVASERFRVEAQTESGMQALRDHTLARLEQSLASEEFSAAAAELLRQGVVLIWGSMEVLAQDVFVTVINARPELGATLLEAESTKRLFQLKAIPLTVLARHSFNVAGRLGAILIEERTIDSIPVMKAVFGVLFPQDEELRTSLKSHELWLLNQRRHLIVHRRGLVDQNYIDNTGEAFPVGFDLGISPQELEVYLKSTVDAGTLLLMAAHHQLSA